MTRRVSYSERQRSTGLRLSAVQWRRVAGALRLSAREAEVVRCVFEGETEASAARVMGISRHTVHTHVKRLYRKLAVSDRTELLFRVLATYLSLKSRSGGRRLRSRRAVPSSGDS